MTRQTLDETGFTCLHRNGLPIRPNANDPPERLRNPTPHLSRYEIILIYEPRRRLWIFERAIASIGPHITLRDNQRRSIIHLGWVLRLRDRLQFGLEIENVTKYAVHGELFQL